MLSKDEKIIRKNRIALILLVIIDIITMVIMIAATILSWPTEFGRIMMGLWWILYAVFFLATIFVIQDLYKSI